MSRSIEIELKFEILQPDEVNAFVKKLSLVGEKRIVDVYLDTQDGGLFKRGIFVRLRNHKTLDIKFNKEDIYKTTQEDLAHTHCDEVSKLLPLSAADLSSINETLQYLGLAAMSSPSIDEFKQHNHLVESVIIDKQRRTYKAADFHIDIDIVKDLGGYLEIEYMTNEKADRERIIKRMHDYLRGLHLHYVDTGYNELYWRKHNFAVYLQGKYLLPEDRQLRLTRPAGH